jgi:hypothetical protein
MTKTRWLGVALGGALAAVVGCNKESAPTPEPSLQPTPASGAGASTDNEPAEPAVAPSNRFSETSFDLQIAPKAGYQAGKPAEAEIVLVAKPPFHVNDKYPYKFKTKQTQGIKYPAATLKEGVKLETQRAVLPVSFTPESAGKQRIEGQFSFSVCTEEKCLIEKRPLALDVDVN